MGRCPARSDPLPGRAQMKCPAPPARPTDAGRCRRPGGSGAAPLRDASRPRSGKRITAAAAAAAYTCNSESRGGLASLSAAPPPEATRLSDGHLIEN